MTALSLPVDIPAAALAAYQRLGGPDPLLSGHAEAFHALAELANPPPADILAALVAHYTEPYLLGVRTSHTHGLTHYATFAGAEGHTPTLRARRLVHGLYLIGAIPTPLHTRPRVYQPTPPPVYSDEPIP
jgi:hypothetical protein